MNNQFHISSKRNITLSTNTNKQHQLANLKHHGVTVDKGNFPRKLHGMLKEVENMGKSDIVSWQPHGRCFRVHKQQEFVDQIMPLFFRQTKWPSFQRQLHIYGFTRFSGNGPDKNGYYHRMFLRGKPHLSDYIIRSKVKGTKVRKPVKTALEPDYYTMPYVGVSNKTITVDATATQLTSVTSGQRQEALQSSPQPTEDELLASSPEDNNERTQGNRMDIDEPERNQENRRRLRASLRLSFSAEKLLNGPLIKIDDVDNNDFKDSTSRKKWTRSSLRTSLHSSFTLGSLRQQFLEEEDCQLATESVVVNNNSTSDDYLDELPDDEEVWGELLDTLMDASPELKSIARKSFTCNNGVSTKTARCG